MRTAIVSDLHLGSAYGEDVLRAEEIRRVLLDELGGAERVVLLGDAIELRERPLAPILELARPFFEDLGRAMGGRQVLLVPGNHDHRLAEPLLEELALAGVPLGLEHRGEPRGGTLARIDGWLGEAELAVAYPGVWLRDDVYATHGHYMDCHMSLPRLECLAAAAMMRGFGAPPHSATPEDYERVLRPIYGLSFGFAQSGLARKAARPSERAWRTLSTPASGNGRLRRRATRAALAAGIPSGLWALNRLLDAEFSADISATAITQSGVDAATELARRLQVGAAHVITGHTHRAGPRPDEAWELPNGGSLHNTGSWVFSSAFHHPGRPPNSYWPGTVTWIEEDAAPRRVQLLQNHQHKQLSGLLSPTTPR
ncbi:MAG TPA: metallophosphoesterase [Solirubrobacterales bacterium]